MKIKAWLQDGKMTDRRHKDLNVLKLLEGVLLKCVYQAAQTKYLALIGGPSSIIWPLAEQ